MNWRLVVAMILVLGTSSAHAQIIVPGEDRGTPTMGTCGTSPSVSGSNMRGIITVGTGTVTSCALNFSATLAAVPICVASSNHTGFIRISSTTTSAVTFNAAADMSTKELYYHCLPAP